MEAISKVKGDPLLDGGRPSDDPEGRTIQSLSGMILSGPVSWWEGRSTSFRGMIFSKDLKGRAV